MLSQTITKREVEFNAGESQEFTISDNVKIFHMLISGLYENKIQSIMREVWSNAYDSHIEAGIADLALGEVTYPGVIQRILTTPVNGLDHYKEMMRLLVEDNEALKVYVNVAEG